MILTFKIRHDMDLTEHLRKARQIAEIALKTRTRSSADVRHIGLKSVIANQILKKYSNNKKAKQINHVVLTIPNQSIKVDRLHQRIRLPCLKLELNYQFRNDFEKINQIELDIEYAYVSVTIPEPPKQKVKNYIGVDLNTTGHCAVVGNPTTGKIFKLGRNAQHIHKKYKNIRRNLQIKGKYRKVKRIKNRENRIVRDLNHKISRRIVDTAKENKCGIKLEALSDIRQTAKSSKSFRYSLNSWSFYQLQQMVEYKARLLGIPVIYIEPAYTSRLCSRCGHLGNRNGKTFKCLTCGHVDHADVNASFNIALRRENMDQSNAERDVLEGSTDTPREAMV